MSDCCVFGPPNLVLSHRARAPFRFPFLFHTLGSVLTRQRNTLSLRMNSRSPKQSIAKCSTFVCLLLLSTIAATFGTLPVSADVASFFSESFVTSWACQTGKTRKQAKDDGWVYTYSDFDAIRAEGMEGRGFPCEYEEGGARIVPGPGYAAISVPANRSVLFQYTFSTTPSELTQVNVQWLKEPIIQIEKGWVTVWVGNRFNIISRKLIDSRMLRLSTEFGMSTSIARGLKVGDTISVEFSHQNLPDTANNALTVGGITITFTNVDLFVDAICPYSWGFAPGVNGKTALQQLPHNNLNFVASSEALLHYTYQPQPALCQTATNPHLRYPYKDPMVPLGANLYAEFGGLGCKFVDYDGTRRDAGWYVMTAGSVLAISIPVADIADFEVQMEYEMPDFNGVFPNGVVNYQDWYAVGRVRVGFHKLDELEWILGDCGLRIGDPSLDCIAIDNLQSVLSIIKPPEEIRAFGGLQFDQIHITFSAVGEGTVAGKASAAIVPLLYVRPKFFYKKKTRDCLEFDDPKGCERANGAASSVIFKHVAPHHGKPRSQVASDGWDFVSAPLAITLALPLHYSEDYLPADHLDTDPCYQSSNFPNSVYIEKTTDNNAQCISSGNWTDISQDIVKIVVNANATRSIGYSYIFKAAADEVELIFSSTATRCSVPHAVEVFHFNGLTTKMLFRKYHGDVRYPDREFHHFLQGVTTSHQVWVIAYPPAAQPAEGGACLSTILAQLSLITSNPLPFHSPAGFGDSNVSVVTNKDGKSRAEINPDGWNYYSVIIANNTRQLVEMKWRAIKDVAPKNVLGVYVCHPRQIQTQLLDEGYPLAGDADKKRFIGANCDNIVEEVIDGKNAVTFEGWLNDDRPEVRLEWTVPNSSAAIDVQFAIDLCPGAVLLPSHVEIALEIPTKIDPTTGRGFRRVLAFSTLLSVVCEGTSAKAHICGISAGDVIRITAVRTSTPDTRAIFTLKWIEISLANVELPDTPAPTTMEPIPPEPTQLHYPEPRTVRYEILWNKAKSTKSAFQACIDEVRNGRNGRPAEVHDSDDYFTLMKEVNETYVSTAVNAESGVYNLFGWLGGVPRSDGAWSWSRGLPLISRNFLCEQAFCPGTIRKWPFYFDGVARSYPDVGLAMAFNVAAGTDFLESAFAPNILPLAPICEFVPSISPVSVATGKRYHVFTSAGITYSDAKAACAAKTMRLATVNTYRESRLMFGITPGMRIFLGAQLLDDTWTWETKIPFKKKGQSNCTLNQWCPPIDENTASNNIALIVDGTKPQMVIRPSSVADGYMCEEAATRAQGIDSTIFERFPNGPTPRGNSSSNNSSSGSGNSSKLDCSKEINFDYRTGSTLDRHFLPSYLFNAIRSILPIGHADPFDDNGELPDDICEFVPRTLEVPETGKVFHIMRNALDDKDALFKCTSLEVLNQYRFGQLASITDLSPEHQAAEMFVLRRLVREDSTPAFTGGLNTAGGWSWNTGVGFEIGDFANSSSGTGDYLMVSGEKGFYAGGGSLGKSTTGDFICEFPVTVVLFNEKAMELVTHRITQGEALASCRTKKYARYEEILPFGRDQTLPWPYRDSHFEFALPIRARPVVGVQYEPSAANGYASLKKLTEFMKRWNLEKLWMDGVRQVSNGLVRYKLANGFDIYLDRECKDLPSCRVPAEGEAYVLGNKTEMPYYYSPLPEVKTNKHPYMCERTHYVPGKRNRRFKDNDGYNGFELPPGISENAGVLPQVPFTMLDATACDPDRLEGEIGGFLAAKEQQFREEATDPGNDNADRNAAYLAQADKLDSALNARGKAYDLVNNSIGGKAREAFASSCEVGVDKIEKAINFVTEKLGPIIDLICPAATGVLRATVKAAWEAVQAATSAAGAAGKAASTLADPTALLTEGLAAIGVAADLIKIIDVELFLQLADICDHYKTVFKKPEPDNYNWRAYCDANVINAQFGNQQELRVVGDYFFRPLDPVTNNVKGGQVDKRDPRRVDLVDNHPTFISCPTGMTYVSRKLYNVEMFVLGKSIEEDPKALMFCYFGDYVARPIMDRLTLEALGLGILRIQSLANGGGGEYGSCNLYARIENILLNPILVRYGLTGADGLKMFRAVDDYDATLVTVIQGGHCLGWTRFIDGTTEGTFDTFDGMKCGNSGKIVSQVPVKNLRLNTPTAIVADNAPKINIEEDFMFEEVYPEGLENSDEFRKSWIFYRRNVVRFFVTDTGNNQIILIEPTHVNVTALEEKLNQLIPDFVTIFTNETDLIYAKIEQLRNTLLNKSLTPAELIGKSYEQLLDIFNVTASVDRVLSSLLEFISKYNIGVEDVTFLFQPAEATKNPVETAHKFLNLAVTQFQELRSGFFQGWKARPYKLISDQAAAATSHHFETQNVDGPSETAVLMQPTALAVVTESLMLGTIHLYTVTQNSVRRVTEEMVTTIFTFPEGVKVTNLFQDTVDQRLAHFLGDNGLFVKYNAEWAEPVGYRNVTPGVTVQMLAGGVLEFFDPSDPEYVYLEPTQDPAEKPSCGNCTLGCHGHCCPDTGVCLYDNCVQNLITPDFYECGTPETDANGICGTTVCDKIDANCTENCLGIIQCIGGHCGKLRPNVHCIVANSTEPSPKTFEACAPLRYETKTQE